MVHFLELSVLRIGNFIAQYHFYLVTFVLSSFVTQYVGVENVGFVFIVSSILVALILYAAPPIFRSFGTRNVLVLLALAEMAILLGLAISNAVVPVVVLVTIQSALAYALFIGIDLLIEASTAAESVTGSTRTTYLTITNLAVLLGSLSLSFIVVGDQYWRVFVASALTLIPFLVCALWLFPRVSFPQGQATDGSMLDEFRANASLRRITLAHFFLQVCFSWFSIYVPILLFTYLGFSWQEIGLMLALAMLPYIVLEYPLGFVADTWLGEKEFLTAGFVILAAALFAFPFFQGLSFWWWAGLMIFSRVGAAMVEAMTEVHFFRHVSERSTASITAFRALRPLGSVAGPLVASVALLVLPLPSAFAVFGAVMLLGIPVSLSIVDTK